MSALEGRGHVDDASDQFGVDELRGLAVWLGLERVETAARGELLRVRRYAA